MTPVRLASLIAFGVAPRLLVAGLVILAVWAGFFWATATPGGL